MTALSSGDKTPRRNPATRGWLLALPVLLVFAVGIWLAGSAVGDRGGLFRVFIPTPATPAPASVPPAALVTAQDYLAQGDYDFDRGRYDQAVADYTRAVELSPNLAEAYNNRAYTYMTQQKYAAALPDLDRAIQLRPDYVNALMNRGDIYNYYYNIDYDRAIADYDRVLQLDGWQHTSVCGHRMLAVHHGWNPGTLLGIVTGGANCQGKSPDY